MFFEIHRSKVIKQLRDKIIEISSDSRLVQIGEFTQASEFQRQGNSFVLDT